MDKITEIKLLMTLALVFYAIAITLGRNHRKWNIPRWVHFSAGFTGFILDMWATWEMERLRHAGWEGYSENWFLFGHTIVSTLAIIFFLSMVFLGARHKIKIHRFVAWYVFVPAWVLSYTSGIFLVTVTDNDLLVQTTPVSAYVAK